MFEQQLQEARSQQTQSTDGGSTDEGSVNPIDEDEIWLRIIGGTNKGRVYGKGGGLSKGPVRPSQKGYRSSDPSSTSASEVIDLREQVHKLNEELHAQTEKMNQMEKNIKKAVMKQFRSMFGKMMPGSSKKKGGTTEGSRMPPLNFSDVEEGDADDREDDDEDDEYTSEGSGSL